MPKRWAELPQSVRWLVVIAAVVLWLAIAWAMFVPVADWLAHHDVGSVKGSLHETALDNARGRLLTLAAGVAAAGALVFTALNFNLLRRSSEKTDQWQWRTHELTEQGQVTDRYTRAIEQLGSDKLDVRIGGVYALERVASDSPRDHPAVMEVLTAFIREHAGEQEPPEEGPKWARPDVQAALTVVGRRDATRDIRRPNLGYADLAGAYLSKANLAGLRLAGATLTQSTLTDANLEGEDLAGADLTHADLRGADLRGANLGGALLTDADLTGADLDEADLTGADLTDATWPKDVPVPEGWKLNTGSGRLEGADTGSEPTEAN